MITLLQPRALAPLTRVSAPGTPQTRLMAVTPPAVRLTSIGRRGPPGPAGPAGPAGDGLFTLQADRPLGGQRLVATDGLGGLDYARADAPGDAPRVVGMTQHAVTAGDPVTLRRLGAIEDAAWAWQPGLPVYLGLDGVPTQTLPPTAVFALVIGFALTPTMLFIAPREPVRLA